MIAYDLDGVLCSDTVQFNPIDEYIDLRNDFVLPILYPKGEWAIITGRPIQDLEKTNSWISKHFHSNMPKFIFHNNTDISKSAEYKASVILNNKNINFYIESDSDQYHFLSAYDFGRDVTIVHFKEYISGILRFI